MATAKHQKRTMPSVETDFQYVCFVPTREEQITPLVHSQRVRWRARRQLSLMKIKQIAL